MHLPTHATCALATSSGRWLAVTASPSQAATGAPSSASALVAGTGVLDASGVLTLRAVDATRGTYALWTSHEPTPDGTGCCFRSAANGLLLAAPLGGGRVTASASAPDATTVLRLAFGGLGRGSGSRGGGGGAAAAAAVVPGMLTREWVLAGCDGRRVALLAPQTVDAWVTAHPPASVPLPMRPGGDMTARTGALDGWECFTLRVVEHAASVVALQSAHGRWVSPQPSGPVRATARELGGWERLTLRQAPCGNPAVLCFVTAHDARPLLGASAAGGVECGPAEGGRDEGVSGGNGDASRGRGGGLLPGPSQCFMLLDAAAAEAAYGRSNPAAVLARGQAPGGGGGGGGGGVAHGGVSNGSVSGTDPSSVVLVLEGPASEGPTPAVGAGTGPRSPAVVRVAASADF